MVNFYRRFLPGIAHTLQPSLMHSEGTPRRWSGRPPPPSRRPRLRWQPRYLWRTQPRMPRTPQTHMWEACYNSWPEGTGSRWRSTPRSCRGRAPGTPPSTGSCWPPSARSGISGSYWRDDNSACLPTTSRSSHPCSAPHHRCQPANSNSSPSSPNSHQTSDTHHAKRTWWLTP